MWYNPPPPIPARFNPSSAAPPSFPKACAALQRTWWLFNPPFLFSPRSSPTQTCSYLHREPGNKGDHLLGPLLKMDQKRKTKKGQKVGFEQLSVALLVRQAANEGMKLGFPLKETRRDDLQGSFQLIPCLSHQQVVLWSNLNRSFEVKSHARVAKTGSPTNLVSTCLDTHCQTNQNSVWFPLKVAKWKFRRRRLLLLLLFFAIETRFTCEIRKSPNAKTVKNSLQLPL